MVSDDILLKSARVIGLLGFALLIISSVGGTLLASRTAQKLKFLKGQTFRYHRTVSLIGAAIFLLHPIPLLFAYHTTALHWWNIFVPFTAPKQGILIAWGTLAAYALVVVTISSLKIKQMSRRQWRLLHYGSYLVLFLGLIHSLTISNEFSAHEPFRITEPDKFLLATVAVPAVLLLPIWRIAAAARKHRAKAIPLFLLITVTAAVLGMGSAAYAQNENQANGPVAQPNSSEQTAPPPSVQQNKAQSVIRTAPITVPPGPALTGNFLTTLNASLLGRINPSMNERLTLDYALPRGQLLDLRVENYYEGSYNENPPNDLGHNINEHKLEIQGTYTYPLSKVFSISPALLHHDNFRFHDSYYWGILTLTARLPLSRTVTLTPNLSAERRFSGGRTFYDSNNTLDYAFAPRWTFEATYHRYENLGELDQEPTEKEEQEYGFIYQLPHSQTVALSYFHHIQHDSANDQFSFIHLKYGVSF